MIVHSFAPLDSFRRMVEEDFSPTATPHSQVPSRTELTWGVIPAKKRAPEHKSAPGCFSTV